MGKHSFSLGSTECAVHHNARAGRSFAGVFLPPHGRPVPVIDCVTEGGAAVITWELVVSFALGLVLLYLIGWLLLVPMRFLWRLLAGSLLGGLALWLVNHFGRLAGFSVPLNPFTALVTGLLGLPGLALVIAPNGLL
ncbi:MAG: pro-sigmaK processing inhibitor BofA family protein [Clostridia bacterium]|nr:pro-sigmaK processing inhibitor BofA family protein [Clostridia bacterium]